MHDVSKNLFKYIPQLESLALTHEFLGPSLRVRSVSEGDSREKSIVQKHIQIDAMLRSGFFRKPRSVTVRRFGFSPGFTDNGQNIVSETQNVRVLSYQNVIMSESESVSEDRSYPLIYDFMVIQNRLHSRLLSSIGSTSLFFEVNEVF